MDQEQWIERLCQLACLLTRRRFQVYLLKWRNDLMLCISSNRKIKQHVPTDIE
jgi:hypothetical protein